MVTVPAARQGPVGCVVFVACVLGSMVLPTSAIAGECNTLDPEQKPRVESRKITAETIATLRDFGRQDTGGDQGPAFGVGPDGQRIAVVIRGPNPRTNRFCQALVIVRRSAPARPIIFRLKGDPVRQPYDLRGLLTSNGLFSVNRPRWSPDGASIALLTNVAGDAQVVGVRVANGRTRLLTHAPGGVVDFAWVPGTSSLVYAVRRDAARYRVALEREALGGYHYDARMVPLMSARPLAPAALDVSYRLVSRDSGSERAATSRERAILDPAPPSGRPDAAIAVASGAGSRRAWIAPLDPARWLSPMTLSARSRQRLTRCEYASCTGRMLALWFAGDDVIFLRREGWGESVTAIYRWSPGEPPRRLFATEDALIGCDLAGSTLLCGREASLQPRQLWSLDLATHRQSIVFDPNPGFSALVLPRVHRLHWTGSLKSQGYADLVLPGGEPGGDGYPAIVVQYRTRGFLRGGVGDEYPILAFAARGFAVLSIENAKEYATLANDPAVTDAIQADRLDTTNANERRLQLSNLEHALKTARSRAPLDMTRLGITGMSDAASSAVFALINTKLFATASLGSPTVDRDLLALGGPAAQSDFRSSGYPGPADEPSAFYNPIALTPNADAITAPILLQYPEDEYLGGLHAVAVLQDIQAPVDLYIFPGEPHVKWQAAHRLAIYRRNLAWFDFWLRRREDSSSASETEYRRWRALRAQLCGPVAPRGAPIQLCNQASTSTNSVMRR